MSAEEPGTGGGLRYVAERPSPRMVNQELPYSCQAACVRQLLMDAGLTFAEAELRARIGYVEGWGTTSAAAARVLDELHPALGYVGGAVDPTTATKVFERNPWIASLRTDRGSIHAVIVDELQGGIVLVRDPWGLTGAGSEAGSQATIMLSDFLQHWHWALNNAVFANRRK